MNFDDTSETKSLQAQHQHVVSYLLKRPDDILLSLDEKKTNLIHLALGISGEAGEILDAIKKHAIYNKALNEENLLEELGDIMFYIEGLRQHLGFSTETILRHNIVKLQKRYEKGYSDRAAQERKDKQDENNKA